MSHTSKKRKQTTPTWIDSLQGHYKKREIINKLFLYSNPYTNLNVFKQMYKEDNDLFQSFYTFMVNKAAPLIYEQNIKSHLKWQFNMNRNILCMCFNYLDGMAKLSRYINICNNWYNCIKDPESWKHINGYTDTTIYATNITSVRLPKTVPEAVINTIISVHRLLELDILLNYNNITQLFTSSWPALKRLSIGFDQNETRISNHLRNVQSSICYFPEVEYIHLYDGPCHITEAEKQYPIKKSLLAFLHKHTPTLHTLVFKICLPEMEIETMNWIRNVKTLHILRSISYKSDQYNFCEFLFAAPCRIETLLIKDDCALRTMHDNSLQTQPVHLHQLIICLDSLSDYSLDHYSLTRILQLLNPQQLSVTFKPNRRYYTNNVDTQKPLSHLYQFDRNIGVLPKYVNRIVIEQCTKEQLYCVLKSNLLIEYLELDLHFTFNELDTLMFVMINCIIHNLYLYTTCAGIKDETVQFNQDKQYRTILCKDITYAKCFQE